MNTSKVALYFDPNDPPVLTPEESIISMFEHTDTDGVLYIPEWPYDNASDEQESFFKCRMDWNKTDLENVLRQYESCFETMKKIAENYDSFRSDANEEAMPEEEKQFWNTYLRNFKIGDIDAELIADITDRMETADMVKGIAEKLHSGKEVSEEELSLFNEHWDTSVSDEEETLYDRYREAVLADAWDRVGGNVAAYDMIVCAQRLCRLMALEAPEIIIQTAANLFAQTLVIHTYCRELETVEDVE